jgi:hypothetical protein
VTRTRSPYCRNVIKGERCGKLEAEHPEGRCPRDPARRFAVFAKSPSRASGSFSQAELDFLDQYLRLGLRGGDVRVLARRPEHAAVLKHVTAMRAVIARQLKHREEYCVDAESNGDKP